MKFAAVILSIITIMLSAIFCDDITAVSAEQSTSMSQNKDSMSHHDLDLCSPFCTCVCCASIVTEPIVYNNSLISEIYLKDFDTHYNVSFLNKYLSQIYQPPQV